MTDDEALATGFAYRVRDHLGTPHFAATAVGANELQRRLKKGDQFTPEVELLRRTPTSTEAIVHSLMRRS